MKKIILICEELKNKAGIERMTIELANILSIDYKVKILVVEPFSYEECPFNLNDKIKVLSINSSFNKSLLNFNVSIIRTLRRVLKDEKPNAIITVATPLVRLTAPAVLGLGIKNIAWEHFNLFAGSKIGTIFKIIATWMADNTVVLTKQDEIDYKKFLAPNIITIPNFTNIGINKPSKYENRILLAVGRHVPQKGFDLLIKAWAKTKAPGWLLRIVGSGEEREQNEQLAKNLNVSSKIEFIDAHSDIYKEFQDASCFVLSSRFEGQVLVLIEAKMMGLPCISFDCPNSPKEIIHDKKDGWLVRNEDIDALAKEMTLRLADMERLKKAGIEGLKDAFTRYSPNAVKNKWTNLIEE